MGKHKRSAGASEKRFTSEKQSTSAPSEKSAASKGSTKKSMLTYWPWAVLLLIVIFGGVLRFYHASYPVIGYHNWKETHYITEARNFAEHGFFTYGFLVPYSDLPYLEADPSGAHGDTFPMISIIVGIAFKIFGVSLLVARTVNILFGLGTIIAMFIMMRKLFKRDDIALASAFITAILPLYIYFSHNVQLDNAGVFFMLMTVIFYVNWLDKNDAKNAILTSLFLVLSILTKFSFAIIVVPMLFIFPWKRVLEIPKRWKTYLICIIILLLVPIYIYYANNVLAGKFDTGSVGGGIASVNLKAVTAPETWAAVKAYLAENYGTIGTFRIGFFLAFLGLIAFIGFTIFKTGFTRSARFVIGYVIGTILWFLPMAEKLSGHSYHQFPIAPLFVILISYLSIIIAVNIEIISTLKHIRWIPIVIFCLLISFPMAKGTKQLFDTQFIGLDVAGNYIKEHSSPDETIFTSAHQSFGVLWHADRKGYRPPANMREFTFGEVNRTTRWVFAYQWGLQQFIGNPEFSQHIAENYRLRQVALMQQGQQLVPIYFLFSYGGTTNITNMEEIVRGKPMHTQEYENSYGKIIIQYVNVD